MLQLGKYTHRRLHPTSSTNKYHKNNLQCHLAFTVFDICSVLPPHNHLSNQIHFLLQDVTPSRVSSDLCDETIEMQTCSTLEEPQGKSGLDDKHHSLLPPLSPKLGNVDQQVPQNGKKNTQVEILINLQDNNHTNLILPKNNSNPLVSHNGQVMGKIKEKHLTFSESTEQFQIAKVSPMKENGSVISEGGTKIENISKGMVCVSVNKNSLKSSTPQQIDSHLVPKNTKIDERETML